MSMPEGAMVQEIENVGVMVSTRQRHQPPAVRGVSSVTTSWRSSRMTVTPGQRGARSARASAREESVAGADIENCPRKRTARLRSQSAGNDARVKHERVERLMSRREPTAPGSSAAKCRAIRLDAAAEFHDPAGAEPHRLGDEPRAERHGQARHRPACRSEAAHPART